MIAMQKVAHWRGLKSSKNFQKWASFQAQHFKNFLTPFAEQMLFGHEELWAFFQFEICISFFVCSKAKIILNLQITWRHRVIPSFCGVTNLHLADKQCPIPSILRIFFKNYPWLEWAVKQRRCEGWYSDTPWFWSREMAWKECCFVCLEKWMQNCFGRELWEELQVRSCCCSCLKKVND